MQLYAINQAIESLVDAETGEITNLDALHQLQMQRDEKIENIALFAKNEDAEAEAIDKEIKILQARKKAKQNNVSRLKQYLSENLSGMKFETARVQISYRKSDALQINSISAIPDEFLKPQPPKVDMMALKKLVKSGAVFDGVQLITKQNIQIK